MRFSFIEEKANKEKCIYIVTSGTCSRPNSYKFDYLHISYGMMGDLLFCMALSLPLRLNKRDCSS